MPFDFQIWLKAVNIIKQPNLPIIARLGGFNLLKSYLGSMGNTMEDSGLLDVIQLIYHRSTTANHIMDGGCFDKVIRAHLLIDAAISETQKSSRLFCHAFTGCDTVSTIAGHGKTTLFDR